jgi:hypothetical protein
MRRRVPCAVGTSAQNDAARIVNIGRRPDGVAIIVPSLAAKFYRFVNEVDAEYLLDRLARLRLRPTSVRLRLARTVFDFPPSGRGRRLERL